MKADSEAQSEAENEATAQERATACVVNLIRTGGLLDGRAAEVVRPYGISAAGANVLAILAGAGEPLPPNVISSRLLVTRGAVTQLLDSLEKRSLIRRISHPGDRRMLLIEITDQGIETHQQFQPTLYQHDVEWMGGLSGEEQARLLTLLHKVQAHLGHPATSDR